MPGRETLVLFAVCIDAGTPRELVSGVFGSLPDAADAGWNRPCAKKELGSLGSSLCELTGPSLCRWYSVNDSSFIEIDLLEMLFHDGWRGESSPVRVVPGVKNDNKLPASASRDPLQMLKASADAS